MYTYPQSLALGLKNDLEPSTLASVECPVGGGIDSGGIDRSKPLVISDTIIIFLILPVTNLLFSPQVTVNDLISCLNEWTLDNLRSLNVAGSALKPTSTMDNPAISVPITVSLSKLRNLRVLNVSYTEFDSHSLEIVVEDLPHLCVLDISQSKVNDISSLR